MHFSVDKETTSTITKIAVVGICGLYVLCALIRLSYFNVDEAQPTLEEQFLAEGPSAQVTPITGGDSPYPVNDNPFEKVNIPDVGADLTEEDKIYLAMKWGRLYSAADWVALEKCYTDYEASFDIHNADLEKGLIQLCKLDLKLNQAMDSGDFDSYAEEQYPWLTKIAQEENIVEAFRKRRGE